MSQNSRNEYFEKMWDRYRRRIGRGITFYMWYGGHRDGGTFELFCASSKDGLTWNTNHEKPAFPAAPGKERFDSRYTSTPCIVTMPDRFLLYYSARDWNRDYIGEDGVKRRDGSSPYSHIGVAVMMRIEP